MTHKQISHNGGFTLIELMVAVAIVGILAAIAIPSYQESMRKSRRSDAQGSLMSLASGMERYFTQNNTYCDIGGTGAAAANTCGGAANDTGLPPGTIFAPRGETRTFYTITVFAAQPNNTFTLRATPVVGSAQALDGWIELDSTGARRWDENNDGINPGGNDPEDNWVRD